MSSFLESNFGVNVLPFLSLALADCNDFCELGKACELLLQQKGCFLWVKQDLDYKSRYLHVWF